MHSPTQDSSSKIIRNWSPLGDRIRGLPLRSFPSDGLFVRLPGSLVVGASHLIHALNGGQPVTPLRKKLLGGDQLQLS